jgi:dolichol-phosphate mannosyltransferase
MPSPPALSLVVPTVDEAGGVRETLDGIRRALEGRAFEAIVVDDSSSDGTAELVAAEAARDPRLRLLSRPRRSGGLASAVRAGFEAARGGRLGTLNADGSHDPSDLPLLLAALDEGAELAVASRYAPGGEIRAWPWRRRLLSAAGTALVRLALGTGVSDPLSGYYLLERRLYERVRDSWRPEGFKSLPELIARGRPERAVEVPTRFRDRASGESKLGPAAAAATARALLRLALARGGGA